VDGAANGISVPRFSLSKPPSEGCLHGKSIRKFAAITRIGLDLAKKVFRVHAIDAGGEVVVARKLGRRSSRIRRRRRWLITRIENAALAPSAKALLRAFPGTKMHRQIVPGNARPIAIENRVDEKPIVWRRAANMPVTPGKKNLDPIPLIIPQSIPIHWSALKKADHL